MHTLIFDIWNQIFTFCDLKSQVYLLSLCRHFRDHLSITEVYVGRDESSLNNNILRQKKFEKVEILGIINGMNIVDLSFMPQLKVLHANDLLFGQYAIRHLNLQMLCVNDNYMVHDVGFMSNLQILHACGECGIRQDGIAGLNLIELYVDWNTNITDVSDMTNLCVLSAKFDSGIDHDGILGLNLIELNTIDNEKFAVNSAT
jgi:hypothetical protein